MMRLRSAAAGLVLAGSAALALAEPIPFKQDTLASSSAYTGGALGVLLLSLVAIAAVYILRKRLNLQPGGGQQGRLLRVLESQRLGPRALLSVVEFEGGRYLIAQSEQGISCLVAAPGAATPAMAAGQTAPSLAAAVEAAAAASATAHGGKESS
ncbi:flagellar biosynthetic protein FliO [Oxalobacteraceae bacterium]|nr:flagellar biosynthetic protein FliO [Oxalobacteraceae bacterium]